MNTEFFDANFCMNIIQLEGKTQFLQKVKVIDNTAPIRDNLEFMTCNGLMCLSRTKVNFEIALTNDKTFPVSGRSKGS